MARYYAIRREYRVWAGGETSRTSIVRRGNKRGGISMGEGIVVARIFLVNDIYRERESAKEIECFVTVLVV